MDYGPLNTKLPVWDCFARLDPLTHVVSPSFLCHPTRPDDAAEGGAFQDAPNFCHFRPLGNLVVRSHALCGVASVMKCHSPANLPCVVALMQCLLILGVRMRATCEMMALGRLDGRQWLFASWETLCIPSEGEIRPAAGSATCVGFSLLASHVPCLSTCLASLGAAIDGCTGATMVALAADWSAFGAEGAGYRFVQQELPLVEREGHQCSGARGTLMRRLV